MSANEGFVRAAMQQVMYPSQPTGLISRLITPEYNSSLTFFNNIFFFQGITYASYIHESRALTEGKEPTATKIGL